LVTVSGIEFCGIEIIVKLALVKHFIEFGNGRVEQPCHQVDHIRSADASIYFIVMGEIGFYGGCKTGPAAASRDFENFFTRFQQLTRKRLPDGASRPEYDVLHDTPDSRNGSKIRKSPKRPYA
jgi:hypothetical protein